MFFIVTGPSGCGKSTIVRGVLKEVKDINFSVSHTTRQKRLLEEEGRDYYFVSKEEFEQMIKEENFVESAIVYGNYYGTSKKELEKKGFRNDLILDIDVQGAQQVKGRLKKAIFVFILPPEFVELEERLIKRGDLEPQTIEERLEIAKKEIRYYSQFDYIIINDKLNQAVKELSSIILSVRCRLDIRQKEILSILRSFIEEE